MESDPQKRMLYDNASFSYALLFSIIDKVDSGFIDFNNLNEFFESMGVYPYEEEIISILKRLDKDDDGRITLEEFKNGLIPKNLRSPLTANSSIFSSKVMMSPGRKTNEKRMFSPPKNYQFEAIRKINSPSKTMGSASKLNNSFKTKSPLRNTKLDNSIRNSSKKNLREDEKSINDLKREIKKDLNLSKRLNSPAAAPKKTPERKNQHGSFHQEEKRKNATDSKISYKPLKPILKSPLPHHKKPSHFDSMKKSLEKEMELSRQIHQSFHKKSESFMNSLSKMSKKTSPQRTQHSLTPRDRKNMSDIVDFFKKIIILEREIERIKQDLALRPDFNLMDFFSIFDKNEKGYLNQNEIRQFLDNLGINPNSESFPLFLKRFDRNNFGRFKFKSIFFSFF